MVLGIILLVILLVVLFLYIMLFKEYSEVMANFETLVKVIETRDLLLMRILPEIKSKRIKAEMTELVDKRMSAKKQGNDALIKCDVDINKKLKPIYDEINKSQNPIVREEFRRVINLEKKLKVIRREYNTAVEKYNARITKNPKLFLKYLRMRPLNTYEFKNI